MDSSSVRRFTLADVLALVAALGVGSWLTRGVLANRSLLGSNPSPLLFYFHGMCWAAVSASIALMLLRFRRPRPPWRRLRRQPGFIALFATSLALLSQTIRILPIILSRKPGPGYWLVTIPVPHNVAPLIVTAWSVLAISGRWSPGADWIDRAGMALGALWIASYALFLAWYFMV